VNDIIVEFAGKPVSDNTEEFARRVMEVKANEKVDLVVLRKGKKVEVKGVELPAVPARPEFPRPAPLPFPAFPEIPQLKPLPNPAPALPNPVAVPEGFDSVSYTSRGDSFTLKAKKGDTTYTIGGAFDAAGAPVARTVTFSEGNTSAELAAEKLPAERRREVDALLKTVQRVNP
jgi:serine protease Do